MKIRVVAVGKPDAPFADAIGRYERRAVKLLPLEVCLVKQERYAGDPRRSAEAEWARIRRATEGSDVVLCDESGPSYSSAAFARWVDMRLSAARPVSLVVGGPNGVADAARAEASAMLALAPWTMGHDLARLVLMEQLYRAGTLIRGVPYHRE